jgi:hypothetical protein
MFWTLEAIARILGRCGAEDTRLPDTELFNEGWMLRLVLDWLDRNREVPHELAFLPGAKWYSEALLPSQLLPKPQRAEPKPESHTHADCIVGHFKLRGSEPVIARDAKQLIVIEAKLASPLSAGTKHAPNYDQAARSVASIAYMLGARGVSPALESCAFYVLAPKEQIDAGAFRDLLTKASVRRKVQQRIGDREPPVVNQKWFEDIFLPVLERIAVELLAWESVLDKLPATDETESLRAFYRQCRKYNPLPGERGGTPTAGVAPLIPEDPGMITD